MQYDVIIIGAGPGGIFSAYELTEQEPSLKVAVVEAGHSLEKRHCPIDGDKVKSCIKCKSCSIMSGFGGAGAFSDGKYNITNDIGGTLYEHIGKEKALDLMHYVDEINMRFGGEGTKLYTTAGTQFKKLCIQNKLKLLDASVRHLGTDINYVVLVTALSTATSPSTSRSCSKGSPPGRSSRGGVTVRSMMVLSTPTRHGPPSTIASILPSISSSMSAAVVGLGLPEVLPLGAATGTPAACIMARVTG